MTRDDVIRMAREAGCPDPGLFAISYQRFAALLAAAEREACAKVCEGYGTSVTTKDCAAAIRSRSTP